MIRGLLAAVILAQFPGMPGFGQPPSPIGTAAIVGRVIDAGTGRPVAGVQVGITAAPPGLASLQVGDTLPMDQLMSVDLGGLLSGIRQVLTDSQGRFAFAGLPKGTFSLAGTKAGWSGGNYGQQQPDGLPLPFTLSDGEQATDVTLRLWRNGRITGSVIDEASEPIVGLNVRALRRTWIAGHARYAAAGSGQTDDRGMYRIPGLRTGEYLVLIAQTPATTPAAGGAGGMNIDLPGIQNMIGAGPGTDPNTLLASIAALSNSRGGGGGIRVGNWVLQTSSIVAPVLTPEGRLLAYRTTYFPSAGVSAQATAVRVTAGEERGGIDLQLRPVPVSRVSGTLAGPAGPVASTQIRLLPAGTDEIAPEIGFDSATATTAADGSFAFLAVPPGQYTIRAVRQPSPSGPSPAALGFGLEPTMIQNASGGMTMSAGGSMNIGAMLGAMATIPKEPILFASQLLSVGDADVTDLALTLKPAARITGTAAFEGAGKRPTAEELRRIPIAVERADVGNASPVPLPNPGGGQGGQFDANGQFTTTTLLPGRYFVRAPFSVGGWVLKSAMFNGKDIADAPLDIESTDISGVILTFTDQPAGLSGVVRNAQGAIDTQASVLIFSTDSETWVDFGSAPRKLRIARPDKTGTYRVSGLPAGSYFVVAATSQTMADWQNPELLETFSRGASRITIRGGEKQTLDVRVNR